MRAPSKPFFEYYLNHECVTAFALGDHVNRKASIADLAVNICLYTCSMTRPGNDLPQNTFRTRAFGYSCLIVACRFRLSRFISSISSSNNRSNTIKPGRRYTEPGCCCLGRENALNACAHSVLRAPQRAPHRRSRAPSRLHRGVSKVIRIFVTNNHAKAR